MNPIIRLVIGSAITALVLANVGCSSSESVLGNKPEDRLNPAMSANQKALRIKRDAKNGD